MVEERDDLSVNGESCWFLSCRAMIVAYNVRFRM
jgi:hypothetical protein